MKLTDFSVGLVFHMDGKTYRCTDVGSRVVVAIRLDRVDVMETSGSNRTRQTLGYSQAFEQGWFNGPPYAVNEIVFDENDLKACTL